MQSCESDDALRVLFLKTGGCNEESTREEHEVGEYVLEDLESRSSKEAGLVSFYFFVFLFLSTLDACFNSD